MSFPHDSGPHLAWDEALVVDAVKFVTQDLCFKRCPPEWLTTKIQEAVDDYSRSLDKAWEDEVMLALDSRGLPGCARLKKLRKPRGGSIQIPPGEIDGLLVADAGRRLVVVEIKRTQPTYGPFYWRQEAGQYLRPTKGYVHKHDRKVTWVRENWEAVCEHLVVERHLEEVPESPPEICGILVTKFPNIASVMDPPHQITSMAWLAQDYDQQGKWPWDC